MVINSATNQIRQPLTSGTVKSNSGAVANGATQNSVSRTAFNEMSRVPRPANMQMFIYITDDDKEATAKANKVRKNITNDFKVPLQSISIISVDSSDPLNRGFLSEAGDIKLGMGRDKQRPDQALVFTEDKLRDLKSSNNKLEKFDNFVNELSNALDQLGAQATVKAASARNGNLTYQRPSYFNLRTRNRVLTRLARPNPSQKGVGNVQGREQGARGSVNNGQGVPETPRSSIKTDLLNLVPGPRSTINHDGSVWSAMKSKLGNVESSELKPVINHDGSVWSAMKSKLGNVESSSELKSEKNRMSNGSTMKPTTATQPVVKLSSDAQKLINVATKEVNEATLNDQKTSNIVLPKKVKKIVNTQKRQERTAARRSVQTARNKQKYSRAKQNYTKNYLLSKQNNQAFSNVDSSNAFNDA
jgi:hypothetical protein